MLRIKSKFLILLSGFSLINNTALGQCLNVSCNTFEEINNLEKKSNLKRIDNKQITYLRIGNDVDINQILKKEKKDLKILFDNLLISDIQESTPKNEQFSFDIESDSQYIIDDIVYAEGNVNIFLPFGVFKADKISFNRKTKIFKAFNNLEFDKGRQYLSADYLEYNLKNKIGNVDNVYGIIDFARVNSDLDLNLNVKDTICDEEPAKLIDLPSEIELLSSTNLRLKKSASLNAFSFNFSEINQWRFKSERINLNNDKWNSELIYFTNDPFNKAQLILKSKDFTAEIISGKKVFKSKSSFINFDDKVSIPLGKRTITDSDAQSRWSFGYENNDKDGFFISRSSDPIYLGNNLNFNLKKYFLIQRALVGNSNSFRDKNGSVVSKNIKNDIDYLDYFAINANFKGDFNKYMLQGDIDLKTLNTDKFYDAFSFDLNLIRNIYSYNNWKNEVNKKCKSSDGVDNVQSFDIDMGSYALYEENDIYLAYGLKIISKYKFNKEKFKKNYSFILDYGHFKGKSLVDETQLIELTRLGYNLSLENQYKLFNLNNNKDNLDTKFANTPVLIDQGIYIDSNLATGLYQYSNGDSQNILSFNFGPTIIYGNLDKNFFDYFKLSIKPEFLIKDNQSPFKFDDFNNNSRIKFEFDKQLFGPIIIGFKGHYNINNNSDSYGSIENKIYNLKLSRRAYSVDLQYLEGEKSVMFGFEIFGFGYDRKSPKF